jgi:hypothetical protein
MTREGFTVPAVNSGTIDMRGVAILFNRYKSMGVDGIERHCLSLPSPTSGRVAIVVDGIGSSSRQLWMRRPIRYLEEMGFDVCVFSYRGIDTPYYEPRDTVRDNLNQLVGHLDDYVEYYRNAECLLLTGYSFGGMVVSEWLSRDNGSISAADNFRGSCLIASPIRLTSSRIYYSDEPEKFKDARSRVWGILDDYTSLPETVPSVAPLAVIRSDADGVLDVSAYSFADVINRVRPYEATVPASHLAIPECDTLEPIFKDAIQALCEGHPSVLTTPLSLSA